MTIPWRQPGLSFGEDFIVGTATASYQIEGAAAEDGRTPSIWDTFSHTPGKVVNGDTGDVACDHYHRLEEDLDLMASYGLDAYRFSISWSRVLPNGTGEANQAGLDFYDRLVEGLVSRGIKPVATLYHWDLPQVLEDRGGWPSRDVTQAYAEYAELMGRTLGDRVYQWTTMNEPWCIAYLGHAYGVHAPGKVDKLAALRTVHHINLAHGLGLQALRSVVTKPDAQYSITHNLETCRPIRPGNEEDLAAVEKARAIHNRVWTGPQLKGAYPQLAIELTQHITDWSFVQDGDLETIKQPIDVLGLNWYNPHFYGARTSEDQVASMSPGLEEVVEIVPTEGEHTEMGWLVDESGLEQMLLELRDEFGNLPISITENGRACADELVDGECHDPERVDYLQRHLTAVHRAREAGANVVSYFAWSLMDNFEWAWGYGKRFGITWVDYETLERTPKDSARFMSQFARTKVIPGADPETWTA